MTRDIVDINDFTVLIETCDTLEPAEDSCRFEEPLIAVAFYGSGNVDLNVKYGSQQKNFSNTKGMALSFYADNMVEFIHKVSATKPLRCIVIATAVSHLKNLPILEGEVFTQFLDQLVNPADHYVEGSVFYMTPEMLYAVDQVFNVQYEGKTKMMFFRSQVSVLLSHFFGQLSLMKDKVKDNLEREKLLEAKDILMKNMDSPPSLSELSKLIGLNTFKLKKNFKEFFGVPVFKYLQNERMTRAHELLRNNQITIQEVAWQVGYDSLSSFSNAFTKKYGFRPSDMIR